MIILGIDPGSRATGYGIVNCEGPKSVLIDYGSIGLKGDALHGDRLRHIYEQVASLIEEHKPSAFAIEMPIYAKNAQAMLKLGRAQAAAMLAALNYGLDVDQYSPKEVKKAVTGNGNAAKEQVAYMVQKVLDLPLGSSRISLDAHDALAVALCRAHRQALTANRGGNWDAYVKANPHRVLG